MSVFLTGYGDLGAPFLKPEAPLPEVRRQDVLATPDKSFGRLDHYCRLGLLACSRALRHGGVYSLRGAATRPLPEPCGIVVSTLWGCLATDVAYLESCAQEGCSPHIFAYTLPTVLLGEAALRFNLRGPALALQESPEDFAQSLAPLAAAMDFLLAGDATAMLAGCCEVGAPGIISDSRGAFFVLLEKSPPPAYARPERELALDARGRLLPRGGAVEDLKNLFTVCF